MNDILLKITNGDRTLAQACNHLVYPAAYVPGDRITLTVPKDRASARKRLAGCN